MRSTWRPGSCAGWVWAPTRRVPPPQTFGGARVTIAVRGARGRQQGLNYRRVKWLTFLVATVAVLAMQLVVFDRVFPDIPWGSPFSRAILAALVIIAGVFIFNEYVFRVIAHVNQALVQERERLAALHRISEAVASLGGLERNLATTLEFARRTSGADMVVWAEREPGPGAPVNAVCRLFAGDRHSAPGEAVRLRVGQGVVGRALSSGRPVELSDAATLREQDRPSYPLVAAEHLRSLFAVPTLAGDATTGAVCAGWRRPHRLNAGERAFLENVANQVGTAVANARLYREVQRLATFEERERLAREMHDGIAQALTYLKLKAETLQQHAGGGRWPAVRSGLDDLRRAAVEALGDVRQSIVDLRAAAGRPGGEGFLAHLAEYLHTWSRLNDIECELVAPPGDVHLTVEAEIQVMRIVQEALANVRRHAFVADVRVRVAEGEQDLVFSVIDCGHGFDPALSPPPGHYGLAGIRERAAVIGGSVDIVSALGAGTEISLHLPRTGTPLPLQSEGAAG